MAKEQEKKNVEKEPEKKSNLFLKVMFGNLLILLLFFGFMFCAWVIHGFSYKNKMYFTPKQPEPYAITPYVGDEFYENCGRGFFHCRPSQFSSSRNGHDTSCYCYQPNVGTYLFAPGFIYGEYSNSGNMDLEERVRFPYWIIQIVYAYVITGVIIYLFRRKMGK